MTHKNIAGREDLRTRRTRMQLQDAMIRLTIEKGFSAITVQDISALAMVNRATFYRYYQDKYDLLDRYMEEQYNQLLFSDESGANASGAVENPNEPPIGLVRMWEHIQTHAPFFRVMLGPKGDPAFIQKIRDFIEKRFRSVLPVAPEPATSLPFELCLSYISSASVGSISWWLENDMPCSPRQMAAWGMQLSNADLAATLGQAALQSKNKS